MVTAAAAFLATAAFVATAAFLVRVGRVTAVVVALILAEIITFTRLHMLSFLQCKFRVDRAVSAEWFAVADLIHKVEAHTHKAATD